MLHPQFASVHYIIKRYKISWSVFLHWKSTNRIVVSWYDPGSRSINELKRLNFLVKGRLWLIVGSRECAVCLRSHLKVLKVIFLLRCKAKQASALRKPAHHNDLCFSPLLRDRGLRPRWEDTSFPLSSLASLPTVTLTKDCYLTSIPIISCSSFLRL